MVCLHHRIAGVRPSCFLDFKYLGEIPGRLSFQRAMEIQGQDLKIHRLPRRLNLQLKSYLAIV